MIKRIFLITLLIFSMGYLVPSSEAFHEKVDMLYGIDLPIPKNEQEREYLGLSGRTTFKIPQIKAQLVFIEIFSMYCPHCQREAPRVNELYHLINQEKDLKKDIKMIGIGAGNTPFEVDHYKKTYQVPFPLFHDKDYKIHKALGEVRTPFFILVRIYEDGTHKIVFKQLGEFPGAKAFLDVMLNFYGLRKGEKP